MSQFPESDWLRLARTLRELQSQQPPEIQQAIHQLEHHHSGYYNYSDQQPSHPMRTLGYYVQTQNTEALERHFGSHLQNLSLASKLSFLYLIVCQINTAFDLPTELERCNEEAIAAFNLIQSDGEYELLSLSTAVIDAIQTECRQ